MINPVPQPLLNGGPPPALVVCSISTVPVTEKRKPFISTPSQPTLHHAGIYSLSQVLSQSSIPQYPLPDCPFLDQPSPNLYSHIVLSYIHIPKLTLLHRGLNSDAHQEPPAQTSAHQPNHPMAQQPPPGQATTRTKPCFNNTAPSSTQTTTE